jgi:hypothetical protein
MQLGTRFALALLLTTIQFSATSAEDARRKFSKSLFRFRQMKVLRVWRVQRLKLIFPCSPTNSRHSPTPRSVDLHRQRLS